MVKRQTAGAEIERLIRELARLPGLGPRSARRVALHLIAKPKDRLTPLATALAEAAARVAPCPACGNLDTVSPCAICADPARDDTIICVVEGVGDLWALERTGTMTGRYHVLGGVLSPLDGVGPDDLAIAGLLARAAEGKAREIILALNATVEGQTTAHYLADALAGAGVTVSRLAQGVPLGGELDYLDDGTLSAALRARRAWS